MEAMPPEDLRPGQAGTLLDGVANPRDVTATIADLAVALDDEPRLARVLAAPGAETPTAKAKRGQRALPQPG